MIPIAKPYIEEEEINAVTSAMKTGMIAQGSRVINLEQKFSKLCGVKYGVAVNSGTAALHTSLNSVGIKPGDEVITTPFTFIATANSILMLGAKPIFADIEEDTFNISPQKIEDKISNKTKAITTVDLYGHLCDYEKIEEISKKNNIKVIEDACQAVNAEFDGKIAGSFGDIGAFSFYATKNITCGEGGMITTNNDDYSEKAKLFRQHGRSKMTSYEYTGLGFNYRMTDICAAMLLEQLKKLDLITDKRISNAEYLSKGLEKIKGIKIPSVRKGFKHVFHQYTIRVEEEYKLNRDELASYLNKKGIGSSIFYPKPLHLCKHFRSMGYKEGDCPIAEKISKQVISLPVHPSLTKKQMDIIIQVFNEIE